MLYKRVAARRRETLADLIQGVNLAYCGSRDKDLGHKMKEAIGQLRKDD